MLSVQINEIQFIGYELSSRLNGTCPVRVTMLSSISDASAANLTAPIASDARCAIEGLTCACNGIVFFGKDSNWNVLTNVVGSVACSTSVFGMAMLGVQQECYCRSHSIVSATAPSNQTFQYVSSLTPIVYDVTPNNGSSLGGTVVRITGSRFGPASGMTSENVSVVLNGVACEVTAASATEVICVTGERPAPPNVPPLSFSVRSAFSGSPLLDVTRRYWFRYLDRWSDLRTWLHDEPPMEGDFVVIPPSQTILLDVSPPELFFLLIQGSLVFDRRDLTLDSTYIYVLGGLLEIGTPEDPFLNKATITLHGDRYETIHLPRSGAKMIGAMNFPFRHTHGVGLIDLYLNDGSSTALVEIHGRPRKRSWTKLGGTSLAGSDVVITAEDVDFGVGDHVVVTASERGAFTQSEEGVIAEVYSARSFRLEQPLRYNHRSEWYNMTGFAPVDMRSEVGLLTRNVVIQGDEKSESQLFGVHVMVSEGCLWLCGFVVNELCIWRLCSRRWTVR
jgi:hypothetical protein